MTTGIFLGIVAFLVVGVIYGNAKSKWKSWVYRKDINFPEPAVKRTDLYYGYYACCGEQVADTKDHINLFMESQFSGIEKAIQNIADAAMDTAIDVMPQIYEQVNPAVRQWTVRTDAEQRLRDFFMLLRSRGVLKYIKFIYPSDEPNNTIAGYEQQKLGTDIVRKVAAEFTELSGVKLAVIFAAGSEHTGHDLYDYIGLDDYDMKSHVLVGKEFKKMEAALLPHQKLIIVPGGAYGQDPIPFINFAHANAKVGIVMPFLWFSEHSFNVGALGIKDNGMKDTYIATGKKLLNK